MSTRDPKPARREEAGFALIAVIIMLAILMTIALIAFTETGQSRTGTSQASTSTAADAAANTGMSAELYNIETGNFCATMSSSVPTPPLVTGLSNAPRESFSVSEIYSTTYGTWSGSDVLSCTGSPSVLSGEPGGAIVTATGTAVIGGITTTETITDQVFISQIAQQFAALQSSSSASLNLANVIVQQVASLGEIYTNGPLSNMSSGGPSCEGANIVASGSWSDSGCAVAGSITLTGGSLSLNNTTLGGDVTVSGASTCSGSSPVGCVFLMNNATVAGSVLAGANIYLCPGGTVGSPTGCTNSAGSATIDTSANANGSIWFGNSNHLGSCATPTKIGNDTIKEGCQPGFPNQVQPAPSVSFPSFSDPTTFNNSWTSAGWTGPLYVPCNDTGNTTLANDISDASAPTVIVITPSSTCTGGYTLSSNVRLQNEANVAIWAPCGFTVANNGQFQIAAGSTAQLSLISAGQSPSCGGSPTMIGNIATVNNNPFQNGITGFVAAANNFTTNGNVTMTGEVIANLINVSHPLTIKFAGFTPPGMDFGYQALVKQRYISQI